MIKTKKGENQLHKKLHTHEKSNGKNVNIY
jgi:hypothetical protein